MAAAEADFFRFLEAAVAAFGGSAGTFAAGCAFDLGLAFGGRPRFGVGELPRSSALDGGGGVCTGRIADAVVSIVVLKQGKQSPQRLFALSTSSLPISRKSVPLSGSYLPVVMAEVDLMLSSSESSANRTGHSFPC